MCLFGLLLEAEFHTCLKDDDGNLIDVTPKPDGERNILFLLCYCLGPGNSNKLKKILCHLQQHFRIPKI